MAKTNNKDILGLHIQSLVETSNAFSEAETADYTPDKLINYQYNMEKEKFEILREYVSWKRKNPRHFHFNNSDAFKRGLQLLQKNYNPPKRPVKIPTRRGGGQRLNGVEKVLTSFSITEQDREYIYDFIYDQTKENEKFDKTDFFKMLIEELVKDRKNEE